MTATDPRPRAADTRPGPTTTSESEPTESTSDGVTPAIDVETVTFESEGLRCEADHYRPTAGDPPWPTVVMAHGFGAARDWGLAPYAERFAAAGFAAFVFDHRHFGASEGAPRRLIDPDRQLADWAAAIETARSRAATDPDRIALWGTSFSGGHVLETAVRDPDVEAVIAQVPFVDGRATLAHLTREAGLTERGSKLIRAVADRALGAVGLGPIEVPIVTEPGEGGLLDSPGALAGFEAVVPDGVDLENRTPARVVLDIPGYRPGRSAAEIDVPVHVVVAEADRLLPVGPTETMLESLAHPSVHRVEAGHFDVFEPAWVERLVAEQVAFLAEALDVD